MVKSILVVAGSKYIFNYFVYFQLKYIIAIMSLKSIFEILTEAGEAITDIYLNKNFNEETKEDNTPVTLADKKSSEIINMGLHFLFPNIPVLNEENQIPPFQIRNSWKEFFMVDPLDGTKEFIKMNGEFCINLAKIHDSSPVEGWIYQPIEKKGWYVGKGKGVFEFDENGHLTPLKLLPESNEVIRIVTSRSFFQPGEKELLEKIAKKYPVELIHKGSSLKQIAMILNRADMYLKAGPCSEWDTAPGQLMVEESGGCVLRLDTFQKLEYNKPVLKNPHFVMLNPNLNNPVFIQFLKELV